MVISLELKAATMLSNLVSVQISHHDSCRDPKYGESHSLSLGEISDVDERPASNIRSENPTEGGQEMTYQGLTTSTKE